MRGQHRHTGLRFVIAYVVLVFCLLGAGYAGYTVVHVGHSRRPKPATVHVQPETARQLLARGVVIAFLTSLQQGDRAMACMLYPSFASCRSGRFPALSTFRLISTQERGALVIVTVALEGARGKFLLGPAGPGLVIVAAAAA